MSRHDLAGDRADRIEISHVGATGVDVESPTPQHLGRGRDPAGVSTDEVERRPELTEADRCRQTDTGGETGEHHDLSIEPRDRLIVPALELVPGHESEPAPTRRDRELHGPIVE